MNQNEIREEKRTLYERRTRMEDLLGQVGDVIKGYDKTYENKIINDEGVVDDARLEELITQIMSAAHEDYSPEKAEQMSELPFGKIAIHLQIFAFY